MILASHAVVGAGLASLFPQHKIIAFIAAFLSHFILDAIPHWDYQILSESANPNSGKTFMPSRLFYLDLIRIGTDAVIGLTLSILIFGLSFQTLLGAGAAILPDFLQFVYARMPRTPLRHLQRFHQWIHSKRKITATSAGITLQAIFVIIFLVLIFVPQKGHGAELLQDEVNFHKAKVEEIITERKEEVPATDTEVIYQTLRAEILEGENSGKRVIVQNDYTPVEVGDTFIVRHTIRSDGGEYFHLADPYRLPALSILLIAFIVLAVIFGGLQGVRGLISLAGSLLLIMYVLLPGILQGYSPLVVATAVSAIIIILGSFVTHGFNRTTLSAVIGMIITVLATGLLAHFVVGATHLTGFDIEEAVYLNVNTAGGIDFLGLLMGAIIIGLLGVLYDVAIGQAVSVEELIRAGNDSKVRVYRRAIRMGREHIGALINTLAIAYVGAALPLFLLIAASDASLSLWLNREIISAEIVRTLVGGIGVILSVPITTGIAVAFLMKNKEYMSKLLEKEGHTHH